MEKWKNDVAVLCIFFARPEQFRKSFEQVRKARPRVLLLWQDGPREGRLDDVENIMKCREIAENIDWECEVHRNYHDKNMGCDPSTFYSHKWAFSIVDKCIVLEDDLVASESFFPFCKELLDKYENDERIDRIYRVRWMCPMITFLQHSVIPGDGQPGNELPTVGKRNISLWMTSMLSSVCGDSRRTWSHISDGSNVA